MTLVFLGPLRVGGGTQVVLAGTPAYAGVDWRLASGSGTLTAGATHADAAGLASARYEVGAGAAGESVRVEADVYA